MEKITIVLLSTALVAFAGSISTPPDSVRGVAHFIIICRMKFILINYELQDSGIHNFATIEGKVN